jgi:hypothetical protein
MKSTIFAIALLASGAAFAQTDTMTDPAAAPTMMTVSSTGQVQAPSNANPERDARGIPVISDPAIVPAGYNGTPSDGTGGPLVDPVTGEAVVSTDASHPPCSRTITDNCVQTYERGRSPR